MGVSFPVYSDFWGNILRYLKQRDEELEVLKGELDQFRELSHPPGFAKPLEPPYRPFPDVRQLPPLKGDLETPMIRKNE